MDAENSRSHRRKSSRSLTALFTILVLQSFAQFSLGSTVRVTGSGDACPDWPTCFGSWIPPLDDWQVLLEWGHRLNGALLGVVAIVTVLVALYFRFRKHEQQHGTALLISSVTLILITVTGVIGGTVVLSELDPALRTGHLIMALLVSLGASMGLVREWNSDAKLEANRYRRGLVWGTVALLLTLAVLASGSYAVWRGAGLVCTSWPLCDGGLIPQSSLQWIHVAHRLTAVAAFLLAGYALHYFLRHYKSKRVRIYAVVGLAGVVLTTLFGAAVATTINFSVVNETEFILNINRIIHISISSATWTAICLVFASAIWQRTNGSGA